MGANPKNSFTAWALQATHPCPLVRASLPLQRLRPLIPDFPGQQTQHLLIQTVVKCIQSTESRGRSFAERALVGSSDGELVCHGADLRFWFLCTGVDHSGIRLMDEIHFLLREFGPFHIDTPRYSLAYALVLQIWRGVRQQARGSLLRLLVWRRTDEPRMHPIPGLVRPRELFIFRELDCHATFCYGHFRCVLPHFRLPRSRILDG